MLGMPNDIVRCPRPKALCDAYLHSVGDSEGLKNVSAFEQNNDVSVRKECIELLTV